MEVYAIGGKPLMLDGKLCKVAAGGQETWVIDESPNFDNIGEDIFLQIDFISNNTSFNLINVLHSEDIYYGGPTTGVFIVYGSGEWTSQAYRTITFLEPPTGELLTWLQANGIKQ